MKHLKSFSMVSFKYQRSVGMMTILAMMMILASCTDTNQVKFEEANETITFLSDRFPDKNLSLISESDEEFSFNKDGIIYSITEAEDNVDTKLREKMPDIETQSVFRVLRNNEIFYLKYRIGQNELNDHLLDFDENQEEPKKDFIQLFDSNFKLIASSRESDLAKKTENVKELTCTSDNVLGCMEDHCLDAGAIQCGICLTVLVKYCPTALAAICAAEVLTEHERPIYCEKEEE